MDFQIKRQSKANAVNTAARGYVNAGMVRRLHKYGSLYALGGAMYSLMEIGFRGWTHWSMALTGGICLCALYFIETHFSCRRLWRCMLGAGFITAAEFAVGCVVNLLLKWAVWDYSHMPMNLLGQICVPFVLLWMAICLPAGYMCTAISRYVFGDACNPASDEL